MDAVGEGMDKTLKILIIEDVARDAEAIEDELRNESIRFTARRLENRETFLTELKSFAPDIVLSDFTLPDFDALEALRLLRERKYDIPFILVTGTRSEEVAVECLKEGADDYILKASLKRLPSSVLNALQKKEAEREKARAEAALRRSEEQFRLIAENSYDLISLLDLQGRFIYASPSFQTGLGYPPEDLAGVSSYSLVHAEDREPLRAALQDALSAKAGRTLEYRIQHHNGQWRAFESVGTWIYDEQDNPQRLVLVSRDVTQRKQSEELLRGLPQLIREAQEAERRRVARELHDSVNQLLASAKFRLQSVEEKLQDKVEAAWREALKAKALLEKAMQEVRRISRNLRPSELDDFGLVPALQSLCTEFSDRTGVNVELAFGRLPRNLTDEVELNLYRIIQEALNNIEKHSRADKVVLSITKQGSRLTVNIRDNGQGFVLPPAPAKDAQNPGMGLVDMRERSAFIGGTWTLISKPGKGTEIKVQVPLTSSSAQTAKRREEREARKNQVAAGG
jgi:two-component system sensor histidine kinase UhpB